jgi:hypothetical protein
LGTIQQIALTFSITSSFFKVLSKARRKYIINNWGLIKKNYFGWSGVYFIFILHLYITVTFRHTIVFYGKDCFSNIKIRSAWNNGLSMLLLKWSTIVWSKRSRYFLGTIQQIALTFSITSSFFKAKDKYPDFKYIDILNSLVFILFLSYICI